MYRTLLLIWILLHLLGDFYVQTEALAQKKKTSYKALLRHCAYYTFVLAAGTAVFWSLPSLYAAFAVSALHFIIDSVKVLYLKHHKPSTEAIAYYIDQLLHLFTIIIAVSAAKFYAVPFAFAPSVTRFLATFSMDYLTLLKWLCLLAFIIKPANVTIKMLIAQYKPKDAPDDSAQATISEFTGQPDQITLKISLSQKKTAQGGNGAATANAGAFIGTLERIIIALLLSVNQYAAIGLVLTAKSIARYDKIAKEQSFAEYYLLGTLLSTLLVIAAYLFLFTFI